MSSTSSVRRRTLAVILILLVAGAIVAPTLAVGPLAKPAQRAVRAIVDVMVAYRGAPAEPAVLRRPAGGGASAISEPGGEPITVATVDALIFADAWPSGSLLSQSLYLGTEGQNDLSGLDGRRHDSQTLTRAQGGSRRGRSRVGGGTAGGGGATGGTGVAAPASGGNASAGAENVTVNADDVAGETNPQQAAPARISNAGLTALAEMLGSDAGAKADADIVASLEEPPSSSALAPPADFVSLLKAVRSAEPPLDAPAERPARAQRESPGEAAAFVPAVLAAGKDVVAALAPTNDTDTSNARASDLSAAVPEPASLILLGTVAGAVLRRSRRGRSGDAKPVACLY